MSGILLQIITSWQVIAVTVALALYISLVNYVGRRYHQPRFSAGPLRRAKKVKNSKSMAKSAPKEAPDDEDSNEALGLEERE